MNPATAQKLDRVRRYSRSLKNVFRFFQFVIIAGGLVSIAIVATVSSPNATFDLGGLQLRGDEITGLTRIIGIVGMLLVFSLSLKLLHHLARLFGLYADGEIFTVASVQQIRKVGISILLFAALFLFNILGNVALIVAGQQDIAIVHLGEASSPIINGNSISTILGGVIIIMISWIMDVGREMREEQDLTV